jgi:CBS domain containing-hemolysin-like protein
MNLHIAFISAIAFTLGISALCSVMEAMILSTTTAEIEALKKKNPKKGQLLERFKMRIEETISTILTLNTLANTLGATLVGGLAMTLFGNQWLAAVSAVLSLAILIFSEIIPKNVGVAYRVPLQSGLVYLLQGMVAALRPVTYLSNLLVRGILRRRPAANDSDEEILLLAQKGAKDGHLTKNEMDMIANALSLDNIRVSEIMTPRTVVTAIDQSSTVGEVFRQFKNIPFGRMPIYAESIDEVVGLVRRRDLLQAVANGDEQKLVRDLKQEVHFIPETVTAAAALQIFLKTHQQLAVVVDEFGSVAGVLTMEDIMEHIIGREIFEKDDLAIDMRELARARHLMMKKRQQVKSGEASVTH